MTGGVYHFWLGASAEPTGLAGADGHPSPTSGLVPSGGIPRAGFECQHKGNLNRGPRIPLRYGSAATLVCQACGLWRQDRPGFDAGPWHPQSYLVECLSREDDR